MISISVISHGHALMLPSLVKQLLSFPEIAQVIITGNISEDINLPANDRLQLIYNLDPKGFGANHNHAFTLCTSPFFCILNPDITFQKNPFPQLVRDIEIYKADLVAPLVVNEGGGIEDSIRYFPTLTSLLKKLVFRFQNCYLVDTNSGVFSPEWIAGMFMLFTSRGFAKLRGFDERYFLYYEDVDICVRLWRSRLKLVIDPSVAVVHDAQRASRHNLRHMRMHLKSMLTYLICQSWRLPKIKL